MKIFKIWALWGISGDSRPAILGTVRFAIRNSVPEKITKPNFWVRMSSCGVEVFYVKGWGPKSSACPSKPRNSKLFGRITQDFCRDIPGVPEKFEKNKLVFNSCPLYVAFLSVVLGKLSIAKKGPPNPKFTTSALPCESAQKIGFCKFFGGPNLTVNDGCMQQPSAGGTSLP